MYLKSIEVQGFKSFANKIVFDFHNGITGIVGPNGSGKSNVADAVRWVLGEQSVRQLRGATMQDVIFAGTENRKPLSFAYVAITLDNSDHQLATDFEEVTVARRLYRSGESEYLMNGNVCRLKEVSELFYDTGIGKEGYSIIGQGQIDKVLSGKPEERRELFDEAAGIVKFKKRKLTAQKKLEDERENLVRVNDILSELERQVEPLSAQAEKARAYLKKKNEQRDYDINIFLLESERISREQREAEANYKIADAQLRETNESYEKIKQDYAKLSEEMESMDEKINAIREQQNEGTVLREKLESQIGILNEQIHTAEMSDEHTKNRLEAIDAECAQREEERKSLKEKKREQDEQLLHAKIQDDEAKKALDAIQEEIARCNAEIESGQKELVELLGSRADIQSRQQHFETMLEQINIRKAELGKRLLDRKTQEEGINAELSECEKKLADVDAEVEKLKEREQELSENEREWHRKDEENSKLLEEAQTSYLRQHSRLESLKNIAERYDGYGNSIRRVMEQRADNPGILGVVSDLIQVDKKYETAIETALGGNIQNIVTEDEQTAKDMIAYLKENRLGRATFLPLSSVRGSDNAKTRDALSDEGALGIASELVKFDKKYDGIASYLLGRVLVVDNIDHATVIARKHKFSLRIVTLEGESLSPGGSITGGAYKNSSGLLARRREIDELEKKLVGLKKDLDERRSRREDIVTAIELSADELAGVREQLQEKYILQNTAKLSVEQAQQKKAESEAQFDSLMEERKNIDSQTEEIKSEREGITGEMERAGIREKEIGEENARLQEKLQEQGSLEEEASKRVSDIALELSSLEQGVQFTQENIDRIDGELEKFEAEKKELLENEKESVEEIEKKREGIEKIQEAIADSDKMQEELSGELAECQKKKEEMSVDYHGFFERQEEASKRQADIDKEMFRLGAQMQKLSEDLDAQTNYLWEEYELTPHSAAEMKNEQYTDFAELKKMASAVKDEIRALGDVNVNAIEEYREIAQRYEFLKKQHDDLTESEGTLVGIIDDLDEGMRKQFAEKFEDIKKEFDKSFKELFGGGHGNLELVEDEDILECGIRIIAQPPGKKLQNMMQLSGGEKALTAIALLFAIQALKPSPFCLLDEIEAALDDSNVTRFANYLGRLTGKTQFIVITHRRGTMAAADRLYGITMQEKGVSTLVSVNLVESELTA